jgi:hypothetical protein
MSRALAHLYHDVGKYVARTARNLPPGAISPSLLAMLVRDLYDLRPGRRASEVFDELAAGLDQPGLDDVRAALAGIDDIESAVRAGEAHSVARAAELAISVEQALRALVDA